MNYWIFKCDPQKYRLNERMADPNPLITWNVTRYREQIQPGDIVFLWETGTERGIRAVLRVDSIPQEIPEIESEQRYWVARDTAIKCRVRGTIEKRDVKLSHSILRETPGLENLSVFVGFQQGTNFSVSCEEGAIIERLINPASTAD